MEATSGSLVVGSPLCLTHSPTPVVGVRPGPADGTFLVTVQSQGVTLFDVATQRALRAWHDRSIHLTHAACFEPTASQLVAVRDHATLIAWAESSDRLAADRSHSLPAAALALFHHSSLRDATLAVLTDGAALLLDAALSPLATLAAPPPAAALWADLRAAPTARQLELTLLLAADELLLHRVTLAADGATPHAAPAFGARSTLLRLGAPPPHPLCGGCLTRGAAAAAAATLALAWGGGELQLWSVPDAPAAPHPHPPHAARIARQLPRRGGGGGGGGGALHALRGGQLLHLSAEAEAEGAPCLRLRVWDATYGMLRCEAALPLHPPLGGGAPLVGACVGGGGACVAAAFPRAVVVCRLQRMPPPTLAHALCAAQKTAAALAPDAAAALVTPARGHAAHIGALLALPRAPRAGVPLPMDRSVFASSWRGEETAGEAREAAVLDALLHAASPAAFEADLAAYLAELAPPAASRAPRASFSEGEGAEEEEGAPRKRRRAAAAAEARHALHCRLSARFVAQVCGRCVGEGSKAWLPPLGPLLASGVAAAAACPALLPALVDAKARRLLVLLVRGASDLSEEHTLLVLRLALQQRAAAPPPAKPKPALVPFAEAKEKGGKEGGEGAEEEEGGWEALLDEILAAPRNDVFLLPALRSLPLSETVELLRRLTALLSQHAAAWDGEGPSLPHVVGWINVLLDAHFAALLMSPPAHALLRSLNHQVRRHVKVCSTLKNLKGHLAQATQKSSVPSKPIPAYGVELCHL
ncbi:hypothetical protein AB1Y20_011745 [Prymnesium parvum]|uniref:Nucleolar protein 11 C-terminal domain-containing protein n=1 Tax=Prymnesium parvum TaxID=97485 RepID=A0AB34IKU9_PRYPA